MKKLTIILLLIVSNAGFCQEIERQVIGSNGNETSNGDITIQSTVGEVMVRTVQGDNITITEGFQQPEIREIIVANLRVYTGITPNGDGLNDNWIIDGIEQYPENEIIIYSRWGDKVWEGTNYDNVNVVWDGRNKNGNELPDATYIYYINLNNGPDVPSSWVQVTN